MNRVHVVPSGSGPCVGYGTQEIRVKLSSAQTDGELSILENRIDPQGGPPLHVHERENETYYVLEGEFEFTCGDDVVRGGVGTFVFAPRGIPHRYQNIGSTAGRLLFTFTPGGIETFFQDLAAESNLTPGRMTELAHNHGITMLN